MTVKTFTPSKLRVGTNKYALAYKDDTDEKEGAKNLFANNKKEKNYEYE